MLPPFTSSAEKEAVKESDTSALPSQDPSRNPSSYSLPIDDEYTQSRRSTWASLWPTRNASTSTTPEQRLWPRSWRAHGAILSGFLQQVCCWGYVNSFGTFLALYQEKLFAGSDVLLPNLIGATITFMILLFSAPVGRLDDMGYARPIMIIAAFLMLIGHVVLSFAPGNGQIGQGIYGLAWFGQGILVGLGQAGLFVTSSQVPSTWFHGPKKGVMLGIVSCGAAVGGVVWSSTIRYLEASLGFANAVRVIGGMLCVITLLAAALAIPCPDFHFRPKPASYLKLSVWIDSSALRSRVFLAFTAGIGFVFLTYYAVFFNLEEWAAHTGVGYKSATPPADFTGPALRTWYLLSMMSAASAIGRLVSSFLADRYGAVPVHTVVTTVCAFLLCVMWVLTRTFSVALAFVLVFGAFAGSLIGLPPASVASILGHGKDKQAKLGQWVGLMYACAAVPELVGPVIGGHLITRYGYLSLQLFCGVGFFAGAGCLALASLWQRKERREEGEVEAVVVAAPQMTQV